MTDGTFICRDAIPCLPEERLIDGPLNAHVTIQSCKRFCSFVHDCGQNKPLNQKKRSWLGHTSIHSAACVHLRSFCSSAWPTELELQKKRVQSEVQIGQDGRTPRFPTSPDSASAWLLLCYDWVLKVSTC